MVGGGAVRSAAAVAVVVAAVLIAGLATRDGSGVRADSRSPRRAVCVLRGTAGHEGGRGVVTFTVVEDGVRIVAELEGLRPGRHGFHVHEFGDISSLDGKSAGGHFNPEGAPHALPPHTPRHVGDLGNLEADASGRAHYERVDRQIRLSGPHGVIGRAIVVHARADDGGQPTGHAGARVAVGVIGIARSK